MNSGHIYHTSRSSHSFTYPPTITNLRSIVLNNHALLSEPQRPSKPFLHLARTSCEIVPHGIRSTITNHGEPNGGVEETLVLPIQQLASTPSIVTIAARPSILESLYEVHMILSSTRTVAGTPSENQRTSRGLIWVCIERR